MHIDSEAHIESLTVNSDRIEDELAVEGVDGIINDKCQKQRP